MKTLLMLGGDGYSGNGAREVSCNQQQQQQQQRKHKKQKKLSNAEQIVKLCGLMSLCAPVCSLAKGCDCYPRVPIQVDFI